VLGHDARSGIHEFHSGANPPAAPAASEQDVPSADEHEASSVRLAHLDQMAISKEEDPERAG
jgi:hypothetical protein